MAEASVHQEKLPWIVIVNRAAAAGRVNRRWERVRRCLERDVPFHEVHFTEYAAHAIEVAEAHASRGHRRFISVGGDGTTHEILTGILRAAPADGSVILGVVPMGTGGDFKRLLKHQRTLEEAIHAITQTPARPIDVGRVRFASYSGQSEERFFLNSTSFGLGGLVDKLANETPKIFGGKVSFYIATLRALAQYKSTRVRLELDGEHAGDHDIANIFVTNGRYTGGGMLVAEHSLLNDGVFEVSMVPERGVFWMMRNVGKLYDGTYRKVPGVLAWKARQVTALHLNERMGLLDVDGENPGKLDAILDIVPRAIRVPNLRDDVLLPEVHVLDDVSAEPKVDAQPKMDASFENGAPDRAKGASGPSVLGESRQEVSAMHTDVASAMDDEGGANRSLDRQPLETGALAARNTPARPFDPRLAVSSEGPFARGIDEFDAEDF